MTPDEINFDADIAFEKQLTQLSPRGVPVELRENVLSHENLIRAKGNNTRFEQVLSISLVLVFVLGLGLCWATQRWQSYRLARILGPTPAELQAEELAKRELKQNPPEDEKNLRSIREEFLVQIQREHQSTSTVHSLTHSSLSQTLAAMESKR